MNEQLFRRYQKFVLVHLLFIITLSVSVLIGWHFNIIVLKRGINGSVSMNPVTAMTFLFSAFTLLSFIDTGSRLVQIGKILAFIILLVGCLRIFEILFPLQTGVSEWLFSDKLFMEQNYGRKNVMAPNTAISFMIVAISFLFYPVKQTSHKRCIADYFAVATLLISFFSIVGYLYNASEFYNVRSFIPMAFPTAVCFFLLSMAILMQRSRAGLMSIFLLPYEGSKMARFLLPCALLIPIATGKLRLIGENSGLYTSEFGTSMVAMLNVLLFVILIWHSTLSINKSNKSLMLQIQRTKELGEKLHIEQQKDFERKRMLDQIQQHKQLIEATISGQEKEKKQIGMELHDHINQILASTKLYLDVAKSTPDMKDELIDKSISQLSYAINEIRQLSKSMVLHTLEESGIYKQILEMTSNIQGTTELQINTDIDQLIFDSLDPIIQTAIYRILEEQLNNIIKHADAQKVNIRFFNRTGFHHLIIHDDGKGFSVSEKRQGIGLANISSRAQLLNGQMNINSEPGKGCALIIQFPII